MKVPQIAKQFGLVSEEFETFVDSTKPEGYKYGFVSDSIDDSADINAIVAAFHEYKAGKRGTTVAEAAAEKERLEAVAAKKQAALANMLITSGFNFDGYKISKYSGYISGDDAVNVERGLALFGAGADIKDKLMESLVVIRRNALNELKESAYALGCNAVIGVDFDYLTLDPQTANIMGGTTYAPYVFGVTANGNAVIIEKTDE
jgi:uncharacterized protein YbjQ (UPF0145 family)